MRRWTSTHAAIRGESGRTLTTTSRSSASRSPMTAERYPDLKISSAGGLPRCSMHHWARRQDRRHAREVTSEHPHMRWRCPGAERRRVSSAATASRSTSRSMPPIITPGPSTLPGRRSQDSGRQVGPDHLTRPTMAVIVRLSPIIRGWAAYYRTVVSAEVFSALDHYVWQLTYKCATYSHPNKPKGWIVGRYFGKFSKFRNDHWVFGHRESGGHLVKFSWTSIDRHVMVKGGASPDDPALTDYWANRRRRSKPPLDDYNLRLLTRQDGLCPLCGDYLLTADQPPESPQQWERWWLRITRKAIAASYLVHHGRSSPAGQNPTCLVHASCHRGLQARQRRNPAQQPCTPSRLA